MEVMVLLLEVSVVLPNTFPAPIINSICTGLETLSVRFGLLLNLNEGICTYSGSQTTSHCSKGVRFLNQQKVLKVTQLEMN